MWLCYSILGSIKEKRIKATIILGAKKYLLRNLIPV